ncbi:MAG: cyclic nucleotide-binding domain-containing protein [Deltaproteobacteria bacterium]|nr:cyclic nucleotide-binding domain-containing protein [Deltaproteobacteria bacterium]
MISTVEKVLFLKGVELFGQIAGEDLAQIAQIADEVEFDQDQMIIREGDLGDSLFLIISGQVRVHQDEREIAQLGERQVFGEMALLDSEPRSASVTALSDVTLLRIQQEDFLDILTEKAEIALGIIKVLSRRLRDALRKNSQ